jgi:hypothetical protein
MEKEKHQNTNIENDNQYSVGDTVEIPRSDGGHNPATIVGLTVDAEKGNMFEVNWKSEEGQLFRKAVSQNDVITLKQRLENEQKIASHSIAETPILENPAVMRSEQGQNPAVTHVSEVQEIDRQVNDIKELHGAGTDEESKLIQRKEAILEQDPVVARVSKVQEIAREIKAERELNGPGTNREAELIQRKEAVLKEDPDYQNLIKWRNTQKNIMDAADKSTSGVDFSTDIMKAGDQISHYMSIIESRYNQ